MFEKVATIKGFYQEELHSVIPFESFKKSATFMPKKMKADTIKTIGLVAYGKDHDADVSLVTLEFY